jgi:hypothetical protein
MNVCVEFAADLDVLEGSIARGFFIHAQKSRRAFCASAALLDLNP